VRKFETTVAVLSIVLLLGVYARFSTQKLEKIAVIIACSEEDEEHIAGFLNKRAEILLEELGYDIIIVRDDKIPLVQADQVIFFYIGHSISYRNHLVLANGYITSLDNILNHIDTERLVILTNTCGGGSWLDIGADGRVIISTSNDTDIEISAYICSDGSITFSPTIVDLIEAQTDGKNTLEEDFIFWAHDIAEFYSLKDAPVIFDGIEGDVWL